MNRIIATLFAASLVSGCASFGQQQQQAAEVPASLQRGYDAAAAGDYVTAEPLLLNSLAEQPNNPYALLALGVVNSQTGRLGEALRYYNSAADFGTDAEVKGTVSVRNAAAGQQFNTVSDMARYNIQQIELASATPVYETVTPASTTTTIYQDATPVYESEPVYETTTLPATTYETTTIPATTYETTTVTPTYDTTTTIPTLGEPASTPVYEAVPYSIN